MVLRIVVSLIDSEDSGGPVSDLQPFFFNLGETHIRTKLALPSIAARTYISSKILSTKAFRIYHYVYNNNNNNYLPTTRPHARAIQRARHHVAATLAGPALRGPRAGVAAQLLGGVGGAVRADERGRARARGALPAPARARRRGGRGGGRRRRGELRGRQRADVRRSAGEPISTLIFSVALCAYGRRGETLTSFFFGQCYFDLNIGVHEWLGPYAPLADRRRRRRPAHRGHREARTRPAHRAVQD